MRAVFDQMKDKFELAATRNGSDYLVTDSPLFQRIHRISQCLLHMPQLLPENRAVTELSAVPHANSSWGMCSKHCNRPCGGIQTMWLLCSVPLHDLRGGGAEMAAGAGRCPQEMASSAQ